MQKENVFQSTHIHKCVIQNAKKEDCTTVRKTSDVTPEKTLAVDLSEFIDDKEEHTKMSTE